MAKRYDDTGQRMTDCCGAFSTYMDGEILCCKKCYREVELGQGDGSEYRPAKGMTADEAVQILKVWLSK